MAVPAASEAEGRSFYGQMLGLTELPKPASLAARGGVWFALPGGLELHLGVESDFRPAAKAHPAFRVDDLDGLASRLAAAGHPVTWDDALPGVRRFYSQDPWGNRLEFLT